MACCAEDWWLLSHFFQQAWFPSLPQSHELWGCFQVTSPPCGGEACKPRVGSGVSTPAWTMEEWWEGGWGIATQNR